MISFLKKYIIFNNIRTVKVSCYIFIWRDFVWDFFFLSFTLCVVLFNRSLLFCHVFASRFWMTKVVIWKHTSNAICCILITVLCRNAFCHEPCMLFMKHVCCFLLWLFQKNSEIGLWLKLILSFSHFGDKSLHVVVL